MEQEKSEKRDLIPLLYVGIGILVLVLIAAGVIGLTVWLAGNHSGTVETVRDLFIIGLALESCVFGVIIMMLLVMVIRLVNMLEYEIKPILEKTNETVSTVRGTTEFVGKNVVNPISAVKGYSAGIRRGAEVLFGKRKPRGRNWRPTRGKNKDGNVEES